MTGFENRYGRLDRWLHRFAFASLSAQEALADVGDRLFAAEIREVEVGRPVFISGLPRSGTTVLLNLLVSTGEFAAHTYRDMPFVLCPLFWGRFSRHFGRREGTARERAHGDGLLVSLDSPESFEEIVWKRFWRTHYLEDRIRPWTEVESNPLFEEFFPQHMRKIAAARGKNRYVSKNNVTIARLSTLPGPLSEGVILVPFRPPEQHAASMLVQHLRFLEMHERDSFARAYMTDVGHEEFGLAHRPIDFGGWLEEAFDPTSLEYWLRYWTAAYEHVLQSATGDTHLVSYADLTAAPADGLAVIADRVGLERERLTRSSGSLRPPRQHETHLEGVDPSVLARARELYADLSCAAERVGSAAD